MPRKRPDLTKSEQQRIRSNISRQATQIGNRLSDFAMGKEGVTMSSSQVRAGLGIIQNVLPSLQSTEVTDLTPSVSHADIEQAYEQAIQSMTMQDMKQLLSLVPQEERQALIDSVDETSQ